MISLRFAMLHSCALGQASFPFFDQEIVEKEWKPESEWAQCYKDLEVSPNGGVPQVTMVLSTE